MIAALHRSGSSRLQSQSIVRVIAGSWRYGSVLAMILLLVGTAFAPAPARATTVSNQFSDTLVASVGSPTDIAFTPGGRLVVSTQGGVLYIKDGNTLKTALNLSGKICSDFERGMLGVVFDPKFTENSYIYIFYTYNKFGTCADNSSSSPVNRVSRFTMSGNTVSAGSETVLVDNMLSLNGNHNAGDLLFGKDDYLYIAIGDSGCELNNASRCGGSNQNALKKNYLTGKVLRITRDGGIPTSNPFRGSNSGRCNVTGSTTKEYCQETYLWGLRNPFRMALDTNSSSTKIYVNDVGQNVWEEIDQAVNGANYGWNSREGFCPNGSTSGCGSAPSGLTNPIFAYQHGDCNSITGGAFVPKDLWPSTYNGSYLYADYVCGKIFQLKSGVSTLFASNLGPVTTLQFGPDGAKQALYYASYSGEVRKISTNGPPVAVATADPTYGLAPLQVTFDGSDSTDPEGGALTYSWKFGDGDTATGVNPTHTFEENGVYQVELTVKDPGQRTNKTTVKVDVGNTPPEPEIESPGVSDTFTVGEEITLTGSAIDAQEGALGDAKLSWAVMLHHDQHEHPLFSGTGNNLTFDAPAPEDLLAAGNSYLVINLTATDATGLSRTVTQNFQPKKVDLTVDSSTPGLHLFIEGIDYVTPATITTWAGNVIDLEAHDQVLPSGEAIGFTSWSVEGHASLGYVVPDTDSTVTANYDLIPGPTFIPVADARVRESSPSANEGTSTGLSVTGTTTADYETLLRFEVTGLTGEVNSAKIFLYAYDGTVDGPFIYKTSNTWTETGVTWANRPGSSGGRLDDAGAVTKRTWFVLDVGKAIKGNGTFNFLLRSSNADGVSMYSRESDSFRPRLVVTMVGGGDNASPGGPGGLSGDAPSSSAIDLTWNPGTDNVAVTGYDIFRNGVLLTTVTGTSFTDTSVAASRSYGYRVRARDAAGNVSALTSQINVSTPATTRTLTFTPTADAYVIESSPSSNFGTKTILRAEGGSDPDQASFLAFSVNGLPGSVYRAMLRVFVPTGSGNGATDGPELHKTNTSWTETSITWSNKPVWISSKSGDLGETVIGTWAEYDVTALVIKNGPYGFALVSINTDLAVFSSREGANPPQLVVTAFVTGGAAAAEVPAVTPVATPTATPVVVVTLPATESFEDKLGDGWTADAGFTTTSSTATEGSKAGLARSNGTADVEGKAAAATFTLPEALDEVYVEASVYIDRQGDHSLDLIAVTGTKQTGLIKLVRTADGKLGLVNERTGDITTFGELEKDAWHTIQIRLKSNGSSSQVSVWVDGELRFKDRQQLSRRQIVAVAIGDHHTNRTLTVGFDEVTIDTVCIGTCSDQVVTPTTEAAAETSTPDATAEATATSEVPTEVPTAEATETATPEPTIEPTETPTEPPATVEPEPTPEATADEGA